MIDYVSNNPNDESEVYVAEFVWPSKDKSCSRVSLKPTHKGQQKELKFTFDVCKCDHIFDDLLKLGHIKISHNMPPLDEMKQCPYCKYHNSFTTNDCNVFCRQIQLAINESRLMLHDMQLNKQPFPINTMELQQPKVLVRPHQAEATKGKKCGSRGREARFERKIANEGSGL
jgi:hypothetical protein